MIVCLFFTAVVCWLKHTRGSFECIKSDNCVVEFRPSTLLTTKSNCCTTERGGGEILHGREEEEEGGGGGAGNSAFQLQ